MSTREQDVLRILNSLSGPMDGSEEEQSDEERVRRTLAIVRQGLVERPTEDPQGFLESLGEFVRDVGSLSNPVVAAARTIAGDQDPRAQLRASMRVGASAGAFVTGVATPFINMADVPAEVLLNLGADRAAIAIFNATNRTRRALDIPLSEMEDAAMLLGASRESVEVSRGIAHFAGFVIPIGAAIRVAGKLPMVGAKGAGIVPQFLRDAHAGALMGFFGSEGGLRERSGQAIEEFALWGGMSLVLLSGGATFALWRNKRLFDKDLVQATKEGIRNLTVKYDSSGRPMIIALDKTTSRSFMELMSEEHIMLRSPSAIDLLDDALSETAMVHAISEMAATEGLTRGVLPNVLNASSVVKKLKETFPGLKFQVLRNPKGKLDVMFGTKGLSVQAQVIYRSHGVYPKQRVQYQGEEFSVVAATKEFVVGKHLTTGETTKIPRGELKILPYGEDIVVADLRVPNRDALGTDFMRWYEGKADDAYQAIEEIPSDVLTAKVLRGEITIDELAKRARFEPNAIVYAEDAGLTAAGRDPKALRAGEAAQEIKDQPPTFPLILEDEVAGVVQIQSMQSKSVTLTAPVDLKGEPLKVPRGWMDGVGEDVGRALKADRVVSAEGKVLWEDVNAVIKENALELGWPLSATEPVRFEDLSMLFLRERGLSGPDLKAGASFLAQDIRVRLWNSMPKADKSLITGLQKEWDAVAGSVDSLEELAAMAGYHARRVEGKVFLVDINSGATIVVNNEAAAKEGLKGVQRLLKDEGADAVPEALFSAPSFSAIGRDVVDSYMLFPKDLANLGKDAVDIPIQPVTNLRDWLERIERSSGMKFWTNGFNPIDEGIQKANLEIRPKWVELGNIWGKIDHKDRIAVANIWGDILGKGLDKVGRIKIAQEAGVSTKAIVASEKAIDLMEREGAGRYMELYYTKIRPYLDEFKTWPNWNKMFPEGIPKEISGLQALERMTFDVSHMEKDPALVIQKWIKTKFYNKHVAETWERMNDLVSDPRDPLRMRKGFARDGVVVHPPLSNAEIDAVTKAFGQDGAGVVNDAIKGYLTQIRGHPGQEFRAMRRINERFFKLLRIEGGDSRTVEQLANAYLSVMYGASLGLSPVVITRNVMQTHWLAYPRLGPKWGGDAWRLGTSADGFAGALKAGAVRPQPAGIPMGDVLLENIVTDMPMGKGPMGAAGASLVRGMLHTGRGGQRMSRFVLGGFSSSDDLGRSVAFWWQRLHTEDALKKFEAGAISENEFLTEGMPFFSKVIREEFMKRRRLGSNDKALDFIGKMLADEAHFIYGSAAQPLWQQSVFGRFMGMFSTWPIWAKETYLQRFRLGTPGQKAQFAARTAAMTYSIAIVGAETGVNIWNWIAPASILQWMGGPPVEYAIAAKDAYTAPFEQKPAKIKYFLRQVGRLTIPGQRFYRDFTNATAISSDPRDWAFGLFLGSPKPAFSDFPSMMLRSQFSTSADPELPSTQDAERILEDRAAVLKLLSQPAPTSSPPGSELPPGPPLQPPELPEQ